jgi:hypothetical protein
MIMHPLYKEFQNDQEVVDAVTEIKEKGVSEDDVYILTHDEERTKRVADNADANTVGTADMNFGTAAKNVFRKKGDELRANFDELCFSNDMANAEPLFCAIWRGPEAGSAGTTRNRQSIDGALQRLSRQAEAPADR